MNEKDYCKLCSWAEPDECELQECEECELFICKECRVGNLCAKCNGYELPKYATVLHDDDEDPVDLTIMSTVFSGIGSHFHTTIKTRCGGEHDFYEFRRCRTYRSAMRFIRSSISKFKKEFNKKSVSVKFECHEAQEWFYKDGD